MLEVVSDVALRRPEFRHALPVGFARPDFDRTQSATALRPLPHQLVKARCVIV